MNILDPLKKFWRFLKKDTWQSWVVSLVLAFIIIKFLFFPVLGFVTGSSLPLVVVESCSMYHAGKFDSWWNSNSAWYERQGISEKDFRNFAFRNGLNKGDIILVYGRGDYGLGDVVIFESVYKFPLIHRVVELGDVDGIAMIATKGDNNNNQLPSEKDIKEEEVLGKALLRVPGLGWVKLIFFEGTRPESQRGFCS